MARSTRRPATTSYAAAERTCAARGLRLTPLRYRTYEILADSATPLKAYDLLTVLGTPTEPAHPNTAYRALEFLEAAGLVIASRG